MSDQMSDQLREGDTEVITWSAFLAELGMPPALSELSERQMRYGICSESACQWPIAGWCVACRAKLCLDHLAEHRNLHARERLRADESDRDERDELLAHLVDDGTISAEAADSCDGCGSPDELMQCSCGECLCEECYAEHWALGHMGEGA